MQTHIIHSQIRTSTDVGCRYYQDLEIMQSMDSVQQCLKLDVAEIDSINLQKDAAIGVKQLYESIARMAV